MPRYDREDLDQLLQVLSETKGQWRTTPLTLFAAVRGSEDSDELMVIGRAVNGWTFKWSADEVKDPEERQRILDRAYVPTEWNDGKPMLWVTDHWGGAKG